MMESRNIPGFAEVVEWPTSPVPPMRVVVAEQWRQRGMPAWVVIVDDSGQQFLFGFDSFLGRLFYGATHESSEDAAWVRFGSTLEAEVFPILREAAAGPEWPWLARYVERAAHWAGV